MNNQGISRLGPFNKERARLRIGSLPPLDPGSVEACRIDCRRNHVIAWLDSQYRLMARGKGVMEFLGLEAMCFGEANGG